MELSSTATPYGWIEINRVWLSPFSPPIATSKRLGALGDGQEVGPGAVALHGAGDVERVLHRRRDDDRVEDLLVEARGLRVVDLAGSRSAMPAAFGLAWILTVTGLFSGSFTSAEPRT